MRKIIVKASDVGRRADILVTHELPQFTRSSLSSLFAMQLVSTNGKPVKASYKIRKGDKLEVDTSLLIARPANIELPIIYEDDDVIVLNKPAGVLTHSKGALNVEATVATWLHQHLKKTYHNTKPSTPRSLLGNREGIVHRLDRQTSGVMICARHEVAHKWLQKQFSTRKVKKTYLAIVEGVPEPQAAIIDAPIERNPKRPQTFRVNGGGKPAQTKYAVLKKLDMLNNYYSLLELQPLTGRTHQIRVHLKYIGHPIVGDRVYGHVGDHLYLYAKSLELTLPDGHRKVFQAPEPDYFLELAKS